jgi:hypothetical protein
MRRGRVADKDYLAWIALLPCLVSGKRATVHHVRRYGEPKNDRRTVPLAPEYHQIQAGPQTSIEALGKKKFEARYGIDLEAAIVRLNALYERERDERRH